MGTRYDNSGADTIRILSVTAVLLRRRFQYDLGGLRKGERPGDGGELCGAHDREGRRAG